VRTRGDLREYPLQRLADLIQKKHAEFVATDALRRRRREWTTG
jgi:hypothetical protein